MVVRFDTDAALLPLLGAFGETVCLPDGEEAAAIVDFFETQDDAPRGKAVQSYNWHFTMKSTAVDDAGIRNGELIHYSEHSRDDYGQYRVRHCIPEGQGLSTLVCTFLGYTDTAPAKSIPAGSILLERATDTFLRLEGSSSGEALLLEDA